MEIFKIIVGILTLGVVVSIINNQRVNDFFETIEQWLRRKYSEKIGSSDIFNRFLIIPILKLFVSLSDWTDNINHSGIKTGVRVSVILFLVFFSMYFSLIFLALLFNYYLFVIVFNFFRKTDSGFDESVTEIKDAYKKGSDFGKRNNIK